MRDLMFDGIPRSALRVPKWGRLVGIGLLCLGCGCAGNLAKSSSRLPPPPSEEVRAALGVIAVRTGGGAVPTQFAAPATRGQAAALGALDGTLAAAEVTGHGTMSGSLAGVGVLLDITFWTIGATAGTVVGAFQGVPKSEVEAGQKTLLAACREIDLPGEVRRRVLDAGRSNTRRRFTEADASAPAAGPPPDTVLQLNVLGAGLAGDSHKHANLAAFIRVQAQLIRQSDGAKLYDHTWVQQSGARPFNDWVAADARAFRDEVPRASQAVAEAIVEEVFLSYRAAVKSLHR